ncbi:C-GCAxxG-C-C family (seleno)protein [Plebeiibacterium sediminum]|uniref:C-GCAxxG-C-C family protein n=1 Tax=Plebeiibacterium sediminum TaxID=2992112 RepID=A0AAE3SFX3_9BACT|nr:C-GCAxxG-C-C family (seleno)protein [Plebeiobacterium sediminum]MCW3786678.1 C-GCAxxG-C-C family protein [Plebeiobacterium sediminum]
MKINIAEQLYHGKEGYNCAQAIFKTFQLEYDISEDQIKSASDKGRGKAKNGICGALYAAHQLIDEPSNIEFINSEFIRFGGSIECKELKKNRKLSCKECVRLAASSIQEILSK